MNKIYTNYDGKNHRFICIHIIFDLTNHINLLDIWLLCENWCIGWHFTIVSASRIKIDFLQMNFLFVWILPLLAFPKLEFELIPVDFIISREKKPFKFILFLRIETNVYAKNYNGQIGHNLSSIRTFYTIDLPFDTSQHTSISCSFESFKNTKVLQVSQIMWILNERIYQQFTQVIRKKFNKSVWGASFYNIV